MGRERHAWPVDGVFLMCEVHICVLELYDEILVNNYKLESPLRQILKLDLGLTMLQRL